MVQRAWDRILRSAGVVRRHAPPRIGSDTQARAVREALAAFLSRDEDRFRQLFQRAEVITPADPERAWLMVLKDANYVEPTLLGKIRACVRVFFFNDLFIATDLLTHDDEDQVFSLMLEQVLLVRTMDVRKGDHFLELCLGSGVNAIAASRRGAARVIGVDVSERALTFAKANATLNLPGERGDVPIETLRGSLFEPLAAGEQFDVILVNPPFELVPPGARYFLHSHGGEDGLDVVRAFLPGIDQRLRPGGRFEMYTWSPGNETTEWVTDLVVDALPGYRVEVRQVDRLPLETRLSTFRGRPSYAEWRQRLATRGATYVWGVHIRAYRDGPAGLVRIDAGNDIRACDATLSRWDIDH